MRAPPRNAVVASVRGTALGGERGCGRCRVACTVDVCGRRLQRSVARHGQVRCGRGCHGPRSPPGRALSVAGGCWWRRRIRGSAVLAIAAPLRRTPVDHGAGVGGQHFPISQSRPGVGNIADLTPSARIAFVVVGTAWKVRDVLRADQNAGVIRPPDLWRPTGVFTLPHWQLASLAPLHCHAFCIDHWRGDVSCPSPPARPCNAVVPHSPRGSAVRRGVAGRWFTRTTDAMVHLHPALAFAAAGDIRANLRRVTVRGADPHRSDRARAWCR